MNENTKRRGRILLLAVVTLLVTFAGSAAAAGVISDEHGEPRTSGLEYATHSTTLAPISKAALVVPCPVGTTAIDGGVSSDSEPFTRVDTSAADTDSSGWRVELWNQHPSTSLTAYGWAACVTVG